MKLLFDLHTHTIMSGHAYSTLQENVAAAKEAGLLAYGFSEHAQAMPGSVNNIYFHNFKVLPKEVNGVALFGGVELNIMDYAGNTDADERTMANVHYAIASLHPPCIPPANMAESTAAIVGAMQNPLIKIIGHPDDGRYPLDYDTVVRAAVDTGTVLEVNNSSVGGNALRQGAHENYKVMLEKCVQYGCKVIVGSDAHYASFVGGFDGARATLEKAGFPEELVINTTIDGLDLVLNRK
ncbi:phosphatase [Bengtsoniella intestinalis]|uniref:phosphatase n=1 Tax=Bengtsoniella intestinalis TaxID=3073143 RepID=UPI00391F02E6